MVACAPLIAWFYREPRLVSIALLFSVNFLLTGSTAKHMALLIRQMRFKALALIQGTAQVVSVAVGIAMASFG